MPQYEAGSRVDPPVSVPSALEIYIFATPLRICRNTHAKHIPPATAAALPPELPPALLGTPS